MINEIIGTPAMLELAAEECTEMAQACLKMARHLRNENPTFKSLTTINDNLIEEIADVEICINELKMASIVDEALIKKKMVEKEARAKKRLIPNDIQLKGE